MNNKRLAIGAISFTSIISLCISIYSIYSNVKNKKNLNDEIRNFKSNINNEVKTQIANDVKNEIVRKSSIENIEKSVENEAKTRITNIIYEIKNNEIPKLNKMIEDFFKKYETNIDSKINSFDKRLESMESLDSKIWNTFNRGFASYSSYNSEAEILKTLLENRDDLSSYDIERIIKALKH
ncbi:MAG: hypothetical protein ACI4XM_01315 [Candidatus Coprovivens sp.]